MHSSNKDLKKLDNRREANDNESYSSGFSLIIQFFDDD